MLLAKKLQFTSQTSYWLFQPPVECLSWAVIFSKCECSMLSSFLLWITMSNLEQRPSKFLFREQWYRRAKFYDLCNKRPQMFTFYRKEASYIIKVSIFYQVEFWWPATVFALFACQKNWQVISRALNSGGLLFSRQI